MTGKTSESRESKATAAKSFRPKSYDGSVVVVHPVQTGETLARIAEVYRMKSWQSLWLYNTKIKAVLSGQPDDLKPGVCIMIPRSERGYVMLTKKLQRAIIEADGMADQILYELEAEENEYKAFTTKLDFVGDVAKTIGTLGYASRSSAKALEAVKSAKGQALIAHHLSKNSISKEFATKFAEARGKQVLKALEQTKAAQKYSDKFGEKLSKQAVGYAGKTADKAVQKETGNEEFSWISKAVKAAYSSVSVRKAFQAATKTATAIDLVGAALDWVTPTMVAEYLFLDGFSEGTTADQQKRAKAMVAATTKRCTDQIAQKIKAYEAEMKLLYG